MKFNEFSIGGTWDWRPETPDEIGQKVLKTLDALTRINPYFQPWEFVDHSIDFDPEIDDMESIDLDALSFPLETVRGTPAEIANRGVYRLDDGEPFPAGGYTVSAINRELASPQSVHFGVNAGGSDWAPRSAGFHTDHDQVPDPSIVSYPTFRAVLDTIISIWNVKKAQIYSSTLMKKWDSPRLNFDLDWMVYLSAPLAARIAPPKNVAFERMEGGGLLLIAAEETFDTENPQHMAASHAIRDALAPLNNLAQHAIDKKRKLEARDVFGPGFPGKLITGRESDDS